MSKSVGRQEHDLSGRWLFQIDRSDLGETGKWFARAYDRRGWRTVRVPGAWDFYTPELKDYEGVAWYAVEIPASAVKPERHQRLVFNSVHNHARVWVNGRFLGEHWGGYLPFELDFTRAARPGRKQLLVLRVDNAPKPDWLPGNIDRIVEWVQYGGILRSVKLLSTARTYLSDFYIYAVPRGTGARVTYDVEIANTAAADFRGRIEVAIKPASPELRPPSDSSSGQWRVSLPAIARQLPDEGGISCETALRPPARTIGGSSSCETGCVLKATAEIACRRGSQTRRRLRVDLPRAKLWSPETPALYKAEATLISGGRKTDAVADRFGVRTIEAKDGKILLNGQPLAIRGFNRYDEMGAYGPNPPDAAIRADLLRIKQVGANLLRTHYPQDPGHHRLMDEIGLLLMEEIPLNWWRLPAETELGKKTSARERVIMDRVIIRRAEEALAQMIRRDRTHPCVVIWSLCNECGTNTASGISAMRRLLKRTRKLDPTRLATFVAAENVASHKAFADADIVCTNIYRGKGIPYITGFPLGVYEGAARNLKERQECWPGKPLLVTEFGNESIPGFHGRHRFTEEHHAEYLQSMWRAIRQVPGVAGAVVWAWADYRHQRKMCSYHGPFGFYGVVSSDRKEKAAYRMIRKLWQTGNA
ncbi:MAG: glycoside hydrolase family 2 TIM barrel-domain containing protein [Kiritimatiellae bacterium]|nr:glycoside hydrolase family 2 TIM barrel-domain containing protein [Kiritimatiellia bacterium]